MNFAANSSGKFEAKDSGKHVWHAYWYKSGSGKSVANSCNCN